MTKLYGRRLLRSLHLFLYSCNILILPITVILYFQFLIVESLFDLKLLSNNTELYSMSNILYVWETGNIYVRAHVLWTFTLAPIAGLSQMAFSIISGTSTTAIVIHIVTGL